jgi:tetratricopeptide (TPR) repeat protein
MNVGLLTLNFRKYDTAKEQFAAVLEIRPKDYDALIGLGIALRGLGDLDGAEANYKKAKDIDSKRGDAFFNLGVLFKDFRASKQSDLKAAQDAYRTAKDYFKQVAGSTAAQADKDEAKDNIADCDKVISQLDDVIKSMANSGGAGGGTP